MPKEQFEQIIDTHQQLRKNTCFQMAPELALKLAGILDIQEYPFQNNVEWDGKGYEPYQSSCIVQKHLLQFDTKKYLYPYQELFPRLQEELDKGNFPILSLLIPNAEAWHGFVLLDRVSEYDYVVVTKMGSLEFPPCQSREDTLQSLLLNKLKVDCLFWTATIHE